MGEDAADFEKQSGSQEMIFQSHAVNQLFPTLSHHLVWEKMIERERLFCLEAHEFRGQSEPVVLPFPWNGDYMGQGSVCTIRARKLFC